ncbi:MAG: glycoside hydrolase family 99-like domain-containing protein [Paludibacteraceae bacterium]|nr:glycoside hydrolase family 99-like domain-containing protein [Paludibacteraceae bacterium]
MDKDIKIIAYYLPQFHPFPENDEWWGKGFTEWINVGKSKPLYPGHKQPVVPGELGYYDLRIPQVREEQVRLAKAAGIHGFCYWHYWFNGHQLMNDIIDDVLASGTPDFPFCFGWANETWKKKMWNVDGTGDKILIEQTYNGEQDYRAHFDYVKKFFKDPRYIRVDNCPFFFIYRPLDFKDVKTFMALWNKWVKEEGIAEKVYFVANVIDEKDLDYTLSLGFSKAVIQLNYRFSDWSLFSRLLFKIERMIKIPMLVTYKDAVKRLFSKEIDMREDVIPTILPRWDHSPRSGIKNIVLHNSTSELFREHVKSVLNGVKQKQNKCIMLKSWNEWAEGNFMEPDYYNGDSYVRVLGEECRKL